VAYAIIRTGGKQFRVEPGATLHVPVIAKEPGTQVEFEALLVASDDGVRAGAPVVEGLRVVGTIVGHGRGEKIIVFKKKRRKQYKRKKGHRQGYTAVKIDSIG